MSKTYVTKVEIDEEGDFLLVNGVKVPKEFLLRLFAFLPDPPSAGSKEVGFDTLIGYLCLVPLIADRSEHFRKHHKLSPEALQAIELADPIYKALNIADHQDKEKAFLIACMAQLGISAEHLGILGQAIFGPCGDDADETLDSEISHTVH
jgi:hypothetical protein